MAAVARRLDRVHRGTAQRPGGRLPGRAGRGAGTILGALAAREPGWGGGSSIGGAPRRPDGSRSSLHPDEVFTIVEAAVTAAG
ncbi:MULTISPECIES: hypothetical protein [Protofrankia]|uniref:hypothetical protein n=1 Tax=Protofrankia TaxID=2994361 RepID=UPI0005B7C3AF|nr:MULTISPECIES: hypothetical protein [Protofrankia]